jgi:basic membrane protein A
MKTTRFLVAAPAALALALAGCGGSTGDSGSDGSATGDTAAGAPTDDSDCASEDVFCVGLVTDTGKVDDKSFNQSAHEGAMAAAEELGGFYKYIETQDTKDYAANIGQFTNKSYDVIVTVGFLMVDATAEAAASSPDTKFIGVDQFYDADAVTATNLTGLIFPADQAGYAAGFLAAKMTKTNKLGNVLGQEIPTVTAFADGFKNGAESVNPDISVAAVFHPAGDNAFTDPVWGAGEAKKMLAQGADVIFGAGGQTGNGALQEVAKASGAGTDVFCIGVDSDQWDTVEAARPCLITSAMKLITQGVTDTVKAAQSGEFEGLQTVGQVGLAPYHDFEDTVPADVKTEVDEVVKQLQDGSLETGVNS